MTSLATNENSDNRLSHAYQMIDSGNVQVLSLDIFDTLLWRKAPLPVDIFLILGQRLKADGWLIDAVPAEAFVELRVQAEYNSRFKKAQQDNVEQAEVTLKEIYWTLNGIFNRITIEQMVAGVKGIINESDIDELVQMEVELEKQLLQFDRNIILLIQYALKRNIALILVSNTYLENDQIRYILDRPSLFMQEPLLPLIKQIFLSCEYGYSKRYGLFATISETIGIPPSKILHIGDNYHSDYEAALQANLSAVHYPKYDQEFAHVLGLEWDAKELRMRQLMLDKQEGDFGVTAMRSKLVYDKAPARLTKADAFFWRYGATVLGPFVIGFIHWIYERCQKLGQPHVFCLMREGRLYANLIKEYAPYYGAFTLQPHELWVSRRYITHACLSYGTPEELLGLIGSHPADRFTVEAFCTYLGLDINQIKPLLKYRNVILDNDAQRNEIASFLGNSDWRTQIVQHALGKRHNFLKYMSTLTNLSSMEQMIVADVGWIGTTQGAIQMICQLMGYPTKLHGLYLGTTHGIDFALMRGEIREGYLLKAGYPPSAVLGVKRGHYALEQTAIADLPPLIDIDDNGQIITGKNLNSKEQRKQAYLVQEGIKAYCHQVGQYIKAGAITWNALNAQLIEQLRHVLVRSSSCPTHHEAISLGGWSHDHVTAKSTATHILGKNKYYETFIRDMVPEAAFEDWEVTWPVAYAAKFDEKLAIVAQSVRMGTMPKDCFLSQDVLPLRIFLDTGHGFPKKASRLVNMRSNANRSFYTYQRLMSVKHPIQRILLNIACPASLIRFRSLRITVNASNQSETKQDVFFEQGAEKKIEVSPCQEIQPATFRIDQEGISLTYTVDMSHAYLVQLRLCCETFPWNEKE